jgi:hypothetical protein
MFAKVVCFFLILIYILSIFAEVSKKKYFHISAELFVPF